MEIELLEGAGMLSELGFSSDRRHRRMGSYSLRGKRILKLFLEKKRISMNELTEDIIYRIFNPD